MEIMRACAETGVAVGAAYFGSTSLMLTGIGNNIMRSLDTPKYILFLPISQPLQSTAYPQFSHAKTYSILQNHLRNYHKPSTHTGDRHRQTDEPGSNATTFKLVSRAPCLFFTHNTRRNCNQGENSMV